MMDDDDAALITIFATDSIIGPISGCLMLMLCAFVWWSACNDKTECQAMHCAHGSPKIVAHECACVEAATK